MKKRYENRFAKLIVEKHPYWTLVVAPKDFREATKAAAIHKDCVVVSCHQLDGTFKGMKITSLHVDDGVFEWCAENGNPSATEILRQIDQVWRQPDSGELLRNMKEVFDRKKRQ